ncbi:hypothetical protein UFOVP703_55 [uncultured Caudovirales phage]|uniref:Uncharacterized protein n=1 Tax=uncultured Caudovirales phage TaxID=2100421 RepID=A0A6J5NPY6_9CAUD|nr:hypothetical protein UFOVP703_55 [uncultured Caudovirales phage]
MSRELDEVLNAPIPVKPKGDATARKEPPPDMEDIETFMGGKGPYAEKPKEPGLLDALGDGARKLVSSEPPAEPRAPGSRRGGTRTESKPYVAGDKRIVNDELTRMGLDKPSLDPGDALDRRGSPVSEEQFNALKASMAAMPREQRGAVLGRKNLPKWMLPALVEANRQLIEEDNRFAQTGQMAAIPTFEARRGKLAEGGMEAQAAGEQARSDIQLGQGTKVPGKATAEQPLLDTATEQLAKAEGREWSKLGMAQRGIYDAGKGLVQAGAGLNAYVLRLAGDEQGAKRFERVASIQQAQREAADEVDMMRRNAVDLGVIAATPAAYFDRMGVQAVSSLTQMLPALASGGIAALGAGNAQKGAQIAMALMSSQVFGQEYVNPEAMEKLSPGERAARASGMAVMEFIGERYGAIPAAMNALMGRAKKVPLEELPRWAEKAIGGLQKRGLLTSPAAASVVRMQAGEQIGEQVTYAGQYLLDGSALGLDKPISVSEYLSGAMDTAVVTLIATGLLQAGGAGALSLARPRGGRPPEEPKPTADFSGGQQGAAVPQMPGAPGGLPAGIPGAPPPDAIAPDGTPMWREPKGGALRSVPPQQDAPFDAGQLLGTPLDAAAHDAATSPTNDRVEPTDPQKEAGNYKKGHVKLGGLDISIENPQGSVRRGVDPDGKAWENQLQSHYGYIRRTEGADDEQIDTFIKPGTPEDYAGPVFVIDQRDPATGKFDKHKVMLGFDTPEEAEAAYRANYTPDWQGLGQLSGMDMPAFKDWVRGGNHKAPFSAGFQEAPSAVQPAAAAAPAEDSLSDDPDFETTWPRPRFEEMAEAGRPSMFNGLEDDPKLLADAVRGVHQETGFGIQARAAEARALLDGLANGTDPATGKPAKPERLKAMRNELAEALDGIDGDLGAYADEFGDKASDKFESMVVPEFMDLRREAAKLDAPPAPAPAPKPAPPGPTFTESEEPWDGGQALANIAGVMPGADPDLVKALKAAGLVDAKGQGTDKGFALMRAVREIPDGPNRLERQQALIDAALGKRKVRTEQRPAAPAPAPSNEAEADFDDAMGDLGAIFGKNPAAGGGNAAAGDVSAAPAAAPTSSAPDPNVTKAGGKPNEHGHISDDTPGVEVFRSPERKDGAHTSFRVVEMADGSWLVGVEHNATSGGGSGGVSGLNVVDPPERRFASRDDTIAAAIRRLRKTWQGLADPEAPGSTKKLRSQAQAMLAWLDGIESGGDKPAAEKKVRKTTARGPATVNGSRMLARINSYGGISLELLSELSVRQPTGKDDKRGRPVMRWFNPVGGDGALFREGGHNIDELARILEDDGYLEPGSIERDYKDAGERARDLIKGDLETPANAQKAQSLDQIEAEQQAEQQAELDAWNAMTPEERADYMRARYGEPEPEPEFPDLSDEAAAEAQAEREAIIAESELSVADADSLLDADLGFDLEWARMIGAGLEDGMRALGFNEQEIADAIRQADEDAAFYEAAEQSRESTESESAGEAVADGAPAAGAVPAPGADAARAARQEAARALEALADKVVNGRERAPGVERADCALFMPCGGMKLDRPAQARDFYTGPLWTTYRKALGGQEPPQLLILSAKHGFVSPFSTLAPYDQLMTEERADELIADIAEFGPPAGMLGLQPRDIQILGGEQYRRVMRAAVAKAKQEGDLPEDASVREFVGGTGEMNRAVKQYVEGLPPGGDMPVAPAEPIAPRPPGGGLSVEEIRARIERLEFRARHEAEQQLKPQVPKSFVGADHWARHSKKAKELLDALTAERLALRKGQLAKLERQLKAALAADPIEAQRQREEARIDAADELIAGLNADQVVALAKAFDMKVGKRRVEELRTLLLMRKADEVLAEAGRLFRGMGSIDMDDESAEWERRFEQLFVEPAKTERAAETAGPQISQADADAKLKEWQAAAQNPKDRGKNSGITVLSLFDHTGVWSAPWVEAGYNVIQVDIKNGDDINDISIESLGDAGIDDVDVVLAAVPCTDFAASGARWWADKDKDGRLEASLDLLNQTKAILEYFRPRVWAIENPVGRIQSVGGLPSPRLIFDPHHYGDPYTKKTLLFGNFNPSLPSANVEPTEGSKIVKLSSSAKAEREATPEGFAYAFFMANGEDFGPVGAPAVEQPAESLLGSYDEAELRARAEAEAARLEAEREEQRKLAAQAGARTRAANAEELRRRQEQIRRERADAAVDDFQLGQEPPSAVVTPSQASGQRDVFGDEPPVSQVRSDRPETAISLRKRVSILESLRDCLRR